MKVAKPICSATPNRTPDARQVEPATRSRLKVRGGSATFIPRSRTTPGWGAALCAPSRFEERETLNDPTCLPGILGEIEEVVGRPAALAIATSYGGLVKEFPSPTCMEGNPARYADNWLVGAVGADLALAIVKELFPIGGRAEIPIARTALRRQFILENSDRLSGAEMATALEMTERAVRRIRSSLRAEGLI